MENTELLDIIKELRSRWERVSNSDYQTTFNECKEMIEKKGYRMDLVTMDPDKYKVVSADPEELKKWKI